MRKAQVFLEDNQIAALKRLAKATGRKQSEIIRHGVDLAVQEAVDAGQPDWKLATLAAAGMWKDHADIDAMREDLRVRYQERFDRLFSERS
jgi:N-acetyl-anhydromuramyl-L-alanine amidase AmpD